MRFTTPAFEIRQQRGWRGACPARCRRAFSLVELLVVVGIIAVLLSILLPSLGRVREQARQTVCCSNLRRIGMAFMAYTRENDDHFPTIGPRAPIPQASSDWIFWEETGPRQRDLNKSAVAPYLSPPLQSVLRCPSDDTDAHHAFFDPPYRFSYVFNLLINNYGGFPDLTSHQIRSPGEKIMLIEEDEHGIGDGSWYPDPIGGTVDWLSIRHDAYHLPETYSTSTDPLVGQGVVNVENPGNIDRRGNVVYCDGHSEFTTRRVVEDPMHYDPVK